MEHLTSCHRRFPAARGRWINWSSLSLVAVLVLGGCAVVSDPTEALAASRAAIRSATTSGARELASFEFNQAVEKQKAAEQAAAINDRARAHALSEQAAIDARVSDAKARAVKARKAASEVHEANRVLQEEMMRQRN